MSEHPITPPPELVQQWCHKWTDAHGEFGIYLATKTARWGADQQLEECVAWLDGYEREGWAAKLRAARRPKPPSLAEQALALINHDPDNQPFLSKKGIATLRRALERLQQFEQENQTND